MEQSKVLPVRKPRTMLAPAEAWSPLALGIPGSGTTAVMLAAFQMYGLQPGPLLFEEKFPRSSGD